MSNLTKNITWAIITLIAIALIFSFFFSPQTQPQTLSLNQLVTDINAGQVKQIKVNGDELDITLTNNTLATAQKEDESGVTETLKNLGVNDQALQSVDLEVVNQTGWDYWLTLLLPDILTFIAV
jgi:ATP-dependent Zn protease